MTLKDYVTVFKEDLIGLLPAKIKSLSEEKSALEKELDEFRTQTKREVLHKKVKDPDVVYAFANMIKCKEEKRLAEVIVELENVLQVKDLLYKIENNIQELDLHSAKQYPVEDLHGKMKRRGSVFVGDCPFHKETRPSFTVYPKTNSYYCFSCHKGGDSIDFVMRTESLGFLDAVRRLT